MISANLELLARQLVEQAFLARSVETEVLGKSVRVACLEYLTQGKLWEWSDPRRRPGKRMQELRKQLADG